LIELVRRRAKVPGESLDGVDVVLNGSLGVVAPLEFLQHRSSERGHRSLLVTPHATRPAERGSRVASAAPAASFKRRSVGQWPSPDHQKSWRGAATNCCRLT